MVCPLAPSPDLQSITAAEVRTTHPYVRLISISVTNLRILTLALTAYVSRWRDVGNGTITSDTYGSLVSA